MLSIRRATYSAWPFHLYGFKPPLTNNQPLLLTINLLTIDDQSLPSFNATQPTNRPTNHTTAQCEAQRLRQVIRGICGGQQAVTRKPWLIRQWLIFFNRCLFNKIACGQTPTDSSSNVKCLFNKNCFNKIWLISQWLKEWSRLVD